jgi:hypothetical protein
MTQYAYADIRGRLIKMKTKRLYANRGSKPGFLAVEGELVAALAETGGERPRIPLSVACSVLVRPRAPGSGPAQLIDFERFLFDHMIPCDREVPP